MDFDTTNAKVLLGQFAFAKLFVEELDEQNRSRTLQRVGKWLGV